MTAAATAPRETDLKPDLKPAPKPTSRARGHRAATAAPKLPSPSPSPSSGPEEMLLRAIFGGNQGARHDTLNDLVTGFRQASPLIRIQAERAGVSGSMVKAMANSMGMSNIRMFEVIGVPKATAEKRAANNTAVTGTPGHAALGLVRLLGIAKEMAENSDSPEAHGFDTARWLGDWIERPQPALGGRKPAEMIDTPTGVETVCKLLGAIESGAYL